MTRSRPRARAAGRAAASWKRRAPRAGAGLLPRRRRSRRCSLLDPAVLPRELLELQPKQVDEALGGAVVELVLDPVGAERVVVEAVRRGAADGTQRSLEELQRHL